MLLSKADGLTRVIYPAMVLDVSVETCRTLDFVWNAKTHLIKKSVMLAMGGFELVDFSTLNNSFKIKWILNEDVSKQSHILLEFYTKSYI